MHKVIIIGSGPAGHTAAIYLARAHLEPLMLEGGEQNTIPGGLLTTTKTVENFPGFPDGIGGQELTDNFRLQSLRHGTVIKTNTVKNILVNPDKTFVVITDEENLSTRSIIIATGSTPLKLDVPGFDIFWQKGISTCAVCDGGLPIFRNKPLAVIGGGDSACEEALYLTNTCSTVYLIHRRDKLRASKFMQDRVFKNPKIKIIWNTKVISINGDKIVKDIDLLDLKGNEKNLVVSGVFVAIGHKPNSSFCQEIIKTDENGYIITDKEGKTNIEGIWAAGDVQDPHYKQAITAAGSGCIVALNCEKWLNNS